MTTWMILCIGFCSLAGAAALAVFTLARSPAAEQPQLGLRGYKRQRALAQSGFFALVEPVVRKVAGWISHLPVPGWRRRASRLLSHAGDYLGLTPNEYLAMVLLGGLAGLGGGMALARQLELAPTLALFTAGLGAYLPYGAVAGERQRRRRIIDRELPSTIDLIAMCMSAGIDFPGAIKKVIAHDAEAVDAPLAEELQRILRELGLGHSRRRALQAFADRTPSEAVRDFVAAVAQAEAKGNPLREVLRIQAKMLRGRRSIVAEEAAARASVLMIGPLVMLLSATLLLIAGPLFLRTAAAAGGGF